MVSSANEKNRDKILTPLSKAIYLSNLEIVDFLLQQKIAPSFESIPITLARVIEEDNTELLEILLKNGLNPEYIYDSGFLIKEVSYVPNPKKIRPLGEKRTIKKMETYKCDSFSLILE